MSAPSPAPRPAPGAAPPPVFALRRGCVEYDGECVVDEVDLEVRAGEFVVVLGGNGTGKTTLVRALLGLVPLAHGRLELFGVPAARFREHGRLAYVPQRLLAAGAVPVSVEEVVLASGISPRRRFNWRRRATWRAAEEALRTVGLWERRRERLDALSGGQQRRVMIANALASGADAYVLDEPTAGVDAASQRRVADALGRLAESGRTVVLVSHDLGPLAPLARRVVVLGRGGHGSVRYDGPPPVPAALADHVWHHDSETLRGTAGVVAGPLEP